MKEEKTTLAQEFQITKGNITLLNTIVFVVATKEATMDGYKAMMKFSNYLSKLQESVQPEFDAITKKFQDKVVEQTNQQGVKYWERSFSSIEKQDMTEVELAKVSKEMVKVCPNEDKEIVGALNFLDAIKKLEKDAILAMATEFKEKAYMAQQIILEILEQKQ